LADENERNALFSYLEDRFGIAKGLFDEYLFFKSSKNWFLSSIGSRLESALRYKISAIGLKAFQRVGAYVKPTTRFIQIFGYFATRAVVEIDEEQLEKLLGAETIPCDSALDHGYVILSIKGRPLGLGLLLHGEIRSQLPRRELPEYVNNS
jgi:NOL1/NOP2/fmu family ribosome biogenesis protein